MDKYKDFKVTKLPPAGPRKGQSTDEYYYFRDMEALKNFPQSAIARSSRRDTRRSSSTGTKRSTK